MSTRNITELSGIEFTGSLGEAFTNYGRQLTALAERWGLELEIAAVDAEAAMSSMKGHMLLFGLDSKVRARRVAKRLKRARDLAAALAEQGERFPRSYRKHFLP
ncbi:hypothetical protein HNP84_002601 [Thermocatellispora tengchongensis]|uniref:Uncharacterized protein n=1 Tax=Thermocatellispora tengchongensis TaxID=1073253 RepID=A0A840P5Y2_9ACTN|nr:hypothetical protein [Thermocatellispora tengchongensis]MBB5132880.1 hypothetical protein [Thermocatellispora tengchongensis]